MFMAIVYAVYMTTEQVTAAIDSILVELNAMLHKHVPTVTLVVVKAGQNQLSLVVEVTDTVKGTDKRPSIEVIKLFGMPEELAVDYARCRLYGIAATLLGRL